MDVSLRAHQNEKEKNETEYKEKSKNDTSAQKVCHYRPGCNPVESL